MAGIITPQDVEKDKAARIAAAASAVTLADYNDTLEDYLKEVRSARGYTDRDPSEYYNSTVERWAQDARDWVEFRDRVMMYGLGILTQYEQTGTAPCTLKEFKDRLHAIKIEWTFA